MVSVPIRKFKRLPVNAEIGSSSNPRNGIDRFGPHNKESEAKHMVSVPIRFESFVDNAICSFFFQVANMPFRRPEFVSRLHGKRVTVEMSPIFRKRSQIFGDSAC